MRLGILLSTDLFVGVLARVDRSGLHIVRHASVPVPAGGDAAAVATAVRELGARLATHPRWAWACLDDREAPLRSVEMPRMPRREVARTLSLDLERYLPFRSEQAYLDFAVVGIGAGPDRQRIAVAGTLRNWVDTIVAGAQAAGLRLRRLEVEAVCLQRSLRAGGVGARAFGVLGVEQEQARLVLFRDGQPILTRRLPVNADLLQEVVRSVQFFLAQDRHTGLEALHVVGGQARALVVDLTAQVRSRVDEGILVQELHVPFASSDVGLRETAALGCVVGK